MNLSLQLDSLRQAYGEGRLAPQDVAEEVLRRIRARGEDHVWTARMPEDQVLAQAHALGMRRAEMSRLPLYGIPFGVKDNVHVAGIATACGCPGYSRVPAETAAAVQLAIDAGAIFVGKQSLDQFATGLNGTRTLGGHCLNVFDPEVIPGGSSSGSGVAVAAGLVSFALGSDTGGSGRVPAAMNNIVGLRPSIGLVSSRGMVYNNRLFDCMPVFARSVEDAYSVLEVIAGHDPRDPISRGDADSMALAPRFPASFRFAVPDTLEFFGDEESARCFQRAVDRLRALGGTPQAIEFTAFREAGRLIFDSALVAERTASYGEVLDEYPRQLVPTVAAILERAGRYSAADAFRAQYRMHELRAQVAAQLRDIDVLVTPTVPRPFRVKEMLAEPLLRNAEVGYYTYGVGPLDLCALALPAGLRRDGLPFGISLVGRAGEDGRLRGLGQRFEASWAEAPALRTRSPEAQPALAAGGR